VIVTAGAPGAAAARERVHLSVSAFQTAVRHTHCAGAAFSAGLIYGLRHDWQMPDRLDLARASGTQRCERSHQEPLPGLGELREFMQSRTRLTASAA
jgi:fructose-1-phosphate kinase PfkB-like protein